MKVYFVDSCRRKLFQEAQCSRQIARNSSVLISSGKRRARPSSPPLVYFTNSSLKQESIGHSIVKSVCKNQIPPLLFGLSVEIDNLLGSRWLNDEFYKLGFGVSYSEVTLFK